MDNFEQKHSEMIERDANAQEVYIENVYSRKITPPEKPKTTFWSIVGVDAVLYTISGIGASILSGIRTGGLFYILEQTLLTEYNLGSAITGSLSTASLITSLLAFEGFLLATGFSNGRRKGKVTISKWSLFVAFLVVMSAGIFSGLGIIDTTSEMNNILNVILALITAIGAGVITYFGGENIGYSFHFYNEEKKRMIEEYKNEYNEYRENALRAYGSSRYNINSKRYKGLQEALINEQVDEILATTTIAEVEIEENNDDIVKDHYEVDKGDDGW